MKKIGKVILSVLIGFLAILLIVGLFGTDESAETDTTTTITTSQEDFSAEETSTKKAETTTTTKAETTTTKKAEILSQRNAVRKAEDYIRFMAFSKVGLIEQLEFEGFSKEDATYAVNHISVNWNEQAYEKGQSYLDMMGFSEDGLREQLDFEGFTKSEIDYAINKLGF